MRVVSFLSPFYLPLVMLFVAFYAWRPLGGGDDFWAHAAIGRYVWEHGVPHQTLYLWSADVPYIAHAYATGLWFYALLTWGGPHVGPYLALSFNVLMCALPFAILWRLGRKRGLKPLWLAPLFLAAIWISAPRFQTRPELFTALFLVILYCILERSLPFQNRQNAELSKNPSAPVGFGNRKSVLCLIPLFILWPHFHGAVLFGLLALWLSVACDLSQFRRAAWALLLVALISTLALFAFNPYGFGYARNWLATGSDTFKRIDEWKPFWEFPKLATYLWAGEIALWLAGTAIWAFNPNRRGAHLAWMLLMLAAFLRARRSLWLTALTSVWVILSNWNEAAPRLHRVLENVRDNYDWAILWRFPAQIISSTKQRFPGLSAKTPSSTKFSSTKLFASHALVWACLGWSIHRVAPRNWPLRATSETLPVALSAELQKHAHRGRIWNDYEFSAAHEWFGGDKTPLWIDLNNAYPDQIMNDYFMLMGWNTDPKEHAKLNRQRADWFNRNRIRVVVLRPSKPDESIAIVGRWLDSSAEWKRVYRQKDGTIWIKKPVNAPAKSR